MLRLRTNAGPAVARNAGLGARRHAARRVRRHRRRGSSRAGSTALLGHFADERVGARRAACRQRAGRRPDRRLRAGTLAARPRSRSRAASRRAPASATSRRRRSSCAPRRSAAIGGFDRQLRFGEDVDAVWRLVEAGWRCRYEPAQRRAPPTAWRRGGRSSPSASPTARRPRRSLAAPPGRAGAGPHQRLERRGVGAAGRRPADRRPSPSPAGRRLALVRKLPGVPATESLRLAGLGHLHAGRLLADAGRRAWWPLLLAGALVSKRVRRRGRRWPPCRRCSSGGIPKLVDDLAYGVGLWKGVLAERETGPLRPRFTSWPGRCRRTRLDAPSRRPVPSRGVTLRLTVDTDDVAGPRRPRRRATPGLVPVVKGNGYGFGRRPLAAIAAELADTIAVGTVHELDDVPAGSTPVVLTPTLAARRTARGRPHRRLARPRRTRSTAGRAGSSSSWRRRCAGSARRATTLVPVDDRGRAPPGCDVVGVQRPPAGRRHRRRAPRRDRRTGSTSSIPPTRCGSATCRPRRTATCATRGPTGASGCGSAPRCGTATSRALHLDADVLDIRRVARRRARRLPASASCRPTARS